MRLTQMEQNGGVVVVVVIVLALLVAGLFIVKIKSTDIKTWKHGGVLKIFYMSYEFVALASYLPT